jgi:hypothetical protein
MNKSLALMVVWAIAFSGNLMVERGWSADAMNASVSFAEGNGRVAVIINGMPVAVYCYQDDQITRPYFAHVRTLNGLQVTRNHPPIEKYDIADHSTIHPGIWMSFGDIDGSDYWRNKARVRHAEFTEPPRGKLERASFAVRNEFFDEKRPTKVVCNENTRYTFAARADGFLLLWDSTFSADHKIAFGDQEEMGLGLRVATPLRVGMSGDKTVPPGNGTITNSAGKKDEAEVWGKAAEWCDYSGVIAEQWVGMTIFCHPDNFRPSWFHARDYGLLEANLFGRQAFTKGEKSSIIVQPKKSLRLRYGILVHSGSEHRGPDLKAAYHDYVQLAGK